MSWLLGMDAPAVNDKERCKTEFNANEPLHCFSFSSDSNLLVGRVYAVYSIIGYFHDQIQPFLREMTWRLTDYLGHQMKVFF